MGISDGLHRAPRCSRRALAGVVFLAIGGAASADVPEAVISVRGTAGMAPFTVHVHGLATDLGVGDQLTGRYEWSFGDPGGDYDELVGWNAAHTYDEPGAYTLQLTVTNEAGETPQSHSAWGSGTHPSFCMLASAPSSRLAVIFSLVPQS